MVVKPSYKFEEYESKGKVKIKNPKQAHKYCTHGATLYDHYPDGECWVWVFSDDDVKDLFDKWCRHELV